MSKTSDEALSAAVSELISVCEAIAALTPSGGAVFAQGLGRARAQCQIALDDLNPPAKIPPHPDDVAAETPDPAAAEPAPTHPPTSSSSSGSSRSKP